MATLSIIIPVYNEEKTVQKILEKVKNVMLIGGVAKEIIVVNDCSTDLTESQVLHYKNENPDLNIQYFSHPVNQGKGGALHT